MNTAELMSHTLGVAKDHYVETTLPDGIPSCDCGDATAVLLRGVPLDVVLMMADNVKGVPHGTHADKYEHLKHFAGTPNFGAMRLNAGNVIRNFLNKEIQNGK